MSPTQHAGQSFVASPTEAAHHGISDTNAATIATMISTPSSEYEGYDPDNLEMPMSATTSMDYQDNSGCDSLDMEDVMSVRETRRVWDSEHSNHVESTASTVVEQDKYLTPTKFESGADGDELEWYSDQMGSRKRLAAMFLWRSRKIGRYCTHRCMLATEEVMRRPRGMATWPLIGDETAKNK
mmetsp:Transcript_22991/g.54519  ORF Transcript_22991/g.54519 Transcript_22991/m.54519 type:complete len:183 (-) Transcript_22991:140-688(-)